VANGNECEPKEAQRRKYRTRLGSKELTGQEMMNILGYHANCD
jgi:hypothetical protein